MRRKTYTELWTEEIIPTSMYRDLFAKRDSPERFDTSRGTGCERDRQSSVASFDFDKRHAEHNSVPIVNL